MASAVGEGSDGKPSFSFRKRGNKNFRNRRLEEDDELDEESDSLSAKLEEGKVLRKYRRRQCGVSAEGLMVGEKKEEEKEDDDPFKTKTGGMLDLNAVKNAKKMDDAYDTGIGTAFSAETNRRDEDAEMQKFIEENLAKSKGIRKDDDNKEGNKYLSPEEAALNSVPSFLRESSSKRSEEMLSNQMLSGIPEVDLGLDAKIRNIEATEDAKQRLLKESMMKKDLPSQFVPKNMAVNFVQHNRFNLEESGPPKKKHKKVEEIIEPVVGGGVKIFTTAPKKAPGEKATDDFHYEKFKRQFKRH
ncbi:splicing factor C9orf78 [Oratosquilla oratoria]|uniref:splicing factor C9orf78 n=1 Tax=Oratosquilla oratoria TaxID=337810 RepID=UPI003F759C6C